MAYSDKVLDHYNNPRNVGSFDKSDPNVGTGMVGAPECGDVMKLQVKVNPETRASSKTRSSRPSAAAAPSPVPRSRPNGCSGKTVDEALADQEHRHRQRTEPAAGEDPLLGAGRGRDQGRHQTTTRRSSRRTARESDVEGPRVNIASLSVVTVTPKAVEKIREAFKRESVTGGLRLGVLGGGCSGLSYQFKFDPKPRPTDNVLDFDDVQRLHRSQEHGVSGWHDARLAGFADAIGLCVRESARQEELRLRNVVYGLMNLRA